MVDVDGIRVRYGQLAGLLDERGRRLLAASEAVSAGRGGVTAVSTATGMARSTINRGVAELKAARTEPVGRIRRPGGGRKRAVDPQPGLLPALEALIEAAIRGDPETPLRWVSRSQRNIAEALRRQGFEVSQKLVGVLLRQLEYSCQANRRPAKAPATRTATPSSSRAKNDVLDAALIAAGDRRRPPPRRPRRSSDLRRADRRRYRPSEDPAGACR